MAFKLTNSSMIKKTLLVFLIIVAVMVGGTVLFNNLKDNDLKQRQEKIDKTVQNFGNEVKVTSNVDLNNTDKIDKNTKITVTIPTVSEDYDFYYDEDNNLNTTESEKLGNELKKEISILDWDYTGTYSTLNRVIIKEKKKNIFSEGKISRIKDDTVFELPVNTENEQAFKEAVFKIQADNNAEKEDLSDYLQNESGKPFKLSGKLVYEDGTFETTITDEPSIFDEKFYGDDYEADDPLPAKRYYKRLVLIDDKTNKKVVLITRAITCAIKYPRNYTKKQNTLTLVGAKEIVNRDLNEALNELIIKSNLNNFLRTNLNYTLVSTFHSEDDEIEIADDDYMFMSINE